jgi:hypothetical protein
MTKLGEIPPVLSVLRRRLAAREIHSDDLPAAYVRLLYGLPESTLITSRVDQLAEAEARS